MGVHETEPDHYLEKQFSYPVYVHLKGVDLYKNKKSGKYNRKEFHANPKKYKNLFRNYISVTDVLMNGVYWQKDIARLFELKDISNKKFAIQTIADISDDANGSVPCNIRDSTIENPIYGVDRKTLKITKPYLTGSVDVMAVGNLPNELPRDASGYFGEQIIKYILNDIINGGSEILDKATIVKNGKITKPYAYMKEFAKTL